MDVSKHRDLRYEVGQLFQLAFGVAPPVMLPYPLQVHRADLPNFKTENSSQPNIGISFDGISVKNDQVERSRMGHFGKPVLFPFQFLGRKDYKKFDKLGVLKTIGADDLCQQTFHLPATTMVDFSRTKIMPETPQNAGAPVVEMFGFETWSIRIRGLCLADDAHPNYPTAAEQKKALLSWENIAGGVEVGGELFSEKNIFFIGLKSFNITQIEGRPNVVPFEINCISLQHPEEGL